MADYFAQATDYVSRYGALMIRRLRRPRLTAILAAILAESQTLESAAFQVMQGFNLDDAIGAQLDMIGRLLRVSRGALNDQDYRLRLKVEIRVLHSHGTPEDLIGVVLAALERMELIYERWDYATVIIELRRTLDDPDRVALMGFLRRAASAGVRILLEYPTSNSRAFRFADDGEGAAEMGTDGTGDDLDGSVGGLLNDVME